MLEKQAAQFQKALKVHGVNHCPMCQKDDFEVGETVEVKIEKTAGRPEVLLHAGQGKTFFASLVCRNCGHVALFATNKLGMGTG